MVVNEKTAVEKAVRNMTDLDAAGWAILMVRCDSEADIRRTVEGYIHAKPYQPAFPAKNSTPSRDPDNIKEVTGMQTVKSLSKPFLWSEHAPKEGRIGELDHGAEPALMHYLGKCVDPRYRLERRLLYIPNIFDVIGSPGKESRSPAQMQYIYLLREIGMLKKRGQSNALIVIGCTDGVLCSELREYTYVLDIDYPDKRELVGIIWDACQECAGMASGLEPPVANELAEALRGMREDDVAGIIRLAYAQSENPLAGHAKPLFDAAKEAKKQRIAGVRGLRWIDTDGAGQVGGLETLKQWIRVKSNTFLYPHAAKQQKAEAPKGVLLAGLPGCGKTLLAKCTSQLLSSGETSVPLVQMDFDSMLGKWLGEAEANCEMALRAVEGVAPCVLLIDEIEKVFGGVMEGGSNDAMMHIFHYFLEWMQKDREKPILVIATANKTDRLPPELKRKGRFDETFFTGIPTYQDCLDILKIHLGKKASVCQEDALLEEGDTMESIAEELLETAATERRFLNGADIETIVNAAFCTLFAKRVDSEDIKSLEGDNAQVKRYPLSQVKDALIEELKATRSYFDNNLPGVAQYWIEMNALDFRDAGGGEDRVPLLPNGDYDKQTGKFTGVVNSSSDLQYVNTINSKAEEYARDGLYDLAFRFTLMREIFRQANRK